MFLRPSPMPRISTGSAPPPLFILAVALTAALALLAFPAPASSASRVTLMLNWLPGGSHVPIFYARDAGYYKKAGIEVDIRSARGSRSAFDALRNGKAHFILAEAAELFIQRGGGLDARGTMVYFNRSPNAIFTLKRPDIRDFTDLAGKQIGAPRSSFPRVLFKELGARKKVDLKKVRWLNLSPGDLLPALAGGKVDAVATSTLAAYPYRQAARKKGKSLAIFPYAGAGVNPYSLLLVSVDSVLNRDPEMAAAFVRATAEGTADALSNPRKALGLFLKKNPGQDPDRAEAEWRGALSLIYPEQARKAGLGKFEETRIENMRKILGGIRNIGPTPSSSLYTNELLPVLRPRVGSF